MKLIAHGMLLCINFMGFVEPASKAPCSVSYFPMLCRGRAAQCDTNQCDAKQEHGSKQARVVVERVNHGMLPPVATTGMGQISVSTETLKQTLLASDAAPLCNDLLLYILWQYVQPVSCGTIMAHDGHGKQIGLCDYAGDVPGKSPVRCMLQHNKMVVTFLFAELEQAMRSNPKVAPVLASDHVLVTLAGANLWGDLIATDATRRVSGWSKKSVSFEIPAEPVSESTLFPMLCMQPLTQAKVAGYEKIRRSVGMNSASDLKNILVRSWVGHVAFYNEHVLDVVLAEWKASRNRRFVHHLVY